MATWTTYPKVLSQKMKMFPFSPGTNTGTKKSLELTQDLNPKLRTKSSSSGAELRTLLWAKG